MKIFGIEFAPLNIPVHRRLQTLSIFFLFTLVPVLSTLGIGITVYLLFYTKYWFIALAYLSWIWVIDRRTPERGARRNENFCTWKAHEYAKNYFPANLRLAKGLTLDAKRNYLFCTFPHGVLPVGTFLTIVSNAAGFNNFFPYHKVSGLTLSLNFKIPLVRDLLLLMGSCNSSAKSINYLLSDPEGGRVAVIAVGGAEECFYARPGNYNIVLKNRKGFVKLALKNGSPLVPVFSFGEIELFNQVTFPKGSWLRKGQEWIKRYIGGAPIIVFGRGFFQYTFGPIPQRRPLNVVVGKPIEVQRNENPTQNEIDDLHALFVEQLKNLFNAHKHLYIEDPKHAELIIC